MRRPAVLDDAIDRLRLFGDRFDAFAARRFAWVEARPVRAALVLIVGHVLVWTLWASLSHGNLASSVDPVENWNWGKEWQWGYYKHPPFFAWVVGAWFTLWPRADWAYFLLSATNAALGLAAVWAMVGVIETGRRRLLAVAALVLTPMYGMLALKFNANAVLLSLWPWAVWAFLAALKSPTVLRGAVLGLLLAAAMLSKYVSVVLVLAMLAVMLIDRDRRRLMLSPAAIAAAVVGALATAPHLVHLVHTDFAPLHYAEHVRAASLGQFLDYFVRFPLSQLLFQLPLIALVIVAVAREDRRSLLRLFDWRASNPDRRAMLLLGFGPFLAMTALGVWKWARLTSQWAFPVWFASGWLLASAPGVREERLRLDRVAAVIAVAWVLLLASAPLVRVAGIVSGASVHLEPRAELAREVTRRWHEATGGARLAVVGGAFQLAHDTGFYSPDDPSVLIDYDWKKSPWLSPGGVARTGIALLCPVAAAECEAEGRRLFGPDLLVADVTLARFRFGLAARPVTTRLLMRLPAKSG